MPMPQGTSPFEPPPGALPMIPGMASGDFNPFKEGFLRKPPQAPPKLRKVPGDISGTDLYDQLAAGDPKADAAIKKILKDTREASLEGRELLERGWWQKLLYINGRQWIYYTSRGGWQDKRLARWIPRPVTNICGETVQTIRSMLSGIQPTLRVRPNGNEPVNIITAQIADDMEPVIAEEHEMQTRFFEADFWAPALGVAFLHPHWDRDSSKNLEFVPAMQCPECGFLAHPLDLKEGVIQTCPQCATPVQAFQPGQDENGPVGDYETIGSGVTDVLSPLEVMIPTYCQRWEDVDRLIRLRWRPKSYYDGRPYAHQIMYSSSTSDRSLQMYRSLALMSDLTTAPYSWGGAQPSRVEGAVEAELWIRPSAEYPEGLWCRSVGGQNGEALIIRDEERGVQPGPLPYRDFKNKPLWPWIYYPYEETGGRIWAKGALDSILQKQDQINRGDSMVELIMQRMANPIWLEPKGAEVQRFTGEPGLIVRYNVVAGTNAKPERMEGMSPPSAFFTLRQQYLADVERLAGTEDVLKGSNPAGVEAFSALQLLVERSQSRFTSLFKSRGRAYRDWYAIAIELERSYGPTIRTKSVGGQNRSWTFEIFNRQELAGAVTVVVEDGSTTPKTSLGKRAAVQQAKDLGVFNPADPNTQYSTLELLGVPEISPSLDAQTKAAQMEQEQYEQWVKQGRPAGTDANPTGNPLKVEAWQAHPIHVQQLDQWANSDRIRELTMQDLKAHDEITLHRIEHLIAQQNPFGLPMPTAATVAASQQPTGPDGKPVAGAPAGAPGQPGGGPRPGGGAQAMSNSNTESGAPDSLPGHANSGAPAPR